MTNKANLYVACITAGGLTALEMAFFQWTSPNLSRFLLFLFFGLLASTLKVRLPGMTSTMSASFLFVLIGIAELTFSEAVIMGCAAALVQSLWKTKQRAKLNQIVFNVSSWAVSVGVSYWISHFALQAARTDSLPVLLVLAASLFYVTHTGLLAIILSLTSERPLRQVWQQCHSWAFPYYFVGTALAGLFSFSSRSVGWHVSLLMLPMMYLVFLCYRLYLDRVAHEQA